MTQPTKPEIIKLSRKCVQCRQTTVMHVHKIDYNKWRKGTPIQTAIPYLSTDERELLISNICGFCFDRMFAE